MKYLKVVGVPAEIWIEHMPPLGTKLVVVAPISHVTS
jgi:hypothetical protein